MPMASTAARLCPTGQTTPSGEPPTGHEPRCELVVVGAADGGLTALSTILTSAAAVHGPRVIAVLLSGCDGEGMLGLRAVDEAGGVAVVEDRDANAPPSLLRSRQDLGQPSLHARLDGVAPLLARLADG
jgi:chemotaxis response regulator CheB